MLKQYKQLTTKYHLDEDERPILILITNSFQIHHSTILGGNYPSMLHNAKLRIYMHKV